MSNRAVADPTQCPRCGRPHVTKTGGPSCTAHRRDGAPCGHHPMRGRTVCKNHGGKAPQVERAAIRRLAEREAMASIADVVVEPIDNPLDALANLAADAQAWKDHLAATVASLGAAYRFTDKKESEQLDARVALFERAMDRLQKYLVDWVRLGFEERKVALDEARLELVQRILMAAMELVLGQVAERVDRSVLDEVRAGLPTMWQQAIETTARPSA
jgi:hypothetical protein